MRAIRLHGPGKKSWDEVSKPSIQEDLDAVVRVDAVTICGTDLHILKGDVPTVTEVGSWGTRWSARSRRSGRV